MALITICPRCTSHLGLPADADPAAQVQCPVCEVEFSLATVAPRELPQARMVEHVDDAANEGGAESPHDRLSRLIRSSAERRALAEAPDADAAEIEAQEASDAAYQDADPELAKRPAREDLQLGSSRLDQLLSDLMTTPAAPAPASLAKTELADRTEAPTPAAAFPQDSFAATLTDDFENEFSEIDEPSEEEVVIAAADQAAEGEQFPAELRTSPRRKRRPAGVRTLVGVVGGGALGLLLGAYGLLWLKGPAGDFVGLAKWLPSAMLPSSMSSMADAAADDAAANVASQIDDSTSYATVEQSEPAESPPALANTEEPPMLDAAVTPATALEPAVAEPAASDNAAPPTAWPTSPVVGDLRDVKLYSVAELEELLDAADAAHRQFLAGDLARQESWATMGPAYIALAALAERYTLADPIAYGNQLITKQIAAKNIFRGAVGDPERRNDLATIAARWLQHERRQNQGVVLIGRVRDLHPRGRWTEYIVDVPLGDGVVAANVLFDQVRFRSGDEIAVVGAIIPRPREQLMNYDGDATQLIVAGYAFAPEEFVAPDPTAVTGSQPFELGAGGE